MDRIINFDHGSATQPLPEVVESMMPFLKDNYGNPSSMHVLGQQAKVALDKARGQVAELINAEPEGICQSQKRRSYHRFSYRAFFGASNSQIAGEIGLSNHPDSS